MPDLPTPGLLLDRDRMAANIARMNAAARRHGVALRPHVKTAKSAAIVAEMTAGWSGAVTVSTLREAEEMAAAGCRDILYAVGITPDKLARVAGIAADVTVIVDSVAAAEAVAAAGLPALIEVDSDGHRAGVAPDDGAQLLAIGHALGPGLRGVMTHGGGSYGAVGAAALAAHAELERAGAVRAAETLRAAGLASPIVSVGSTPTALFARDLAGVTEVRVGVYVFMDLVMAGLGVCAVDDIALSVLTSVIGHQPARQWLLVDAGWMALSRDPGRGDLGYGRVCDEAGRPVDLIVAAANQEHGIVARSGGGPIDFARFPIGTRLRVLPNHACATAAQFDAYRVAGTAATIPRFRGW